MSEAKDRAPEAVADAEYPINLCTAAELARISQMLLGASLISGMQPSFGAQVAYGQNLIVTGIFNMTPNREEQSRIFRHVIMGLNQGFAAGQKQVAEVDAMAGAIRPPQDRVN